jgi:inosine-uridine nucleoside N-ribohydrolase
MIFHCFACMPLSPHFQSLFKSVIIMGGALSNPTGNKQPSAEANFFNDAIAARLVLRAGFSPPLVLVPLQATHTTSFRKELSETLQASGPVGRYHMCASCFSLLNWTQICCRIAQVLL